MGSHVKLYLEAAARAKEEEALRAHALEFEREAQDGILSRQSGGPGGLVGQKRYALQHAEQAAHPSAARISAQREITAYGLEPVMQMADELEAQAWKRREPVPLAQPSSSAALLSPPVMRTFGAAFADMTSPDRFAAEPIKQQPGRPALQHGKVPPLPTPPMAAAPAGRPPQEGPPLEDAQADSPGPSLRLLAAQPVAAAGAPSSPALAPAGPWRQGPVVSRAASSPPLPPVPRGGPVSRSPLGAVSGHVPVAGPHGPVDRGVPSSTVRLGEGAREYYDPSLALQERLEAFASAGETGDYSYLAMLPTGRPWLQRDNHLTQEEAGAGRVVSQQPSSATHVSRSAGREKPRRPGGPGLHTPSPTRGEALLPLDSAGGSPPYGRGVPAEDYAGPAGMPVSLSHGSPASPVSPRAAHVREMGHRLAAQEAAGQRAWELQRANAPKFTSSSSSSPEAGLYGRVRAGAVGHGDVGLPLPRSGAPARGWTGGQEQHAGARGEGRQFYDDDDDGGEEAEEGEGDSDDDDEAYYGGGGGGGGLDWSRLASATAEEVEAGLASMTPAQLNLFLRTMDPSALAAAQQAISKQRAALGKAGPTRSPHQPNPTRNGGGGGSGGRTGAGTAAVPPLPAVPLAYQPHYLDGESDSEEEEEEGGGGAIDPGMDGGMRVTLPHRGGTAAVVGDKSDGEDSDAEPMSTQQLALFKRTLKANAGADALVRADVAAKALEARQASLLARSGGGRSGLVYDEEGGGGTTGTPGSSSTRPRAGLSSLAMDEYARAALYGSPLTGAFGRRLAARRERKEEEGEGKGEAFLHVPGAAPGNYEAGEARVGLLGRARAAPLPPSTSVGRPGPGVDLEDSGADLDAVVSSLGGGRRAAYRPGGVQGEARQPPRSPMRRTPPKPGQGSGEGGAGGGGSGSTSWTLPPRGATGPSDAPPARPTGTAAGPAAAKGPAAGAVAGAAGAGRSASGGGATLPQRGSAGGRSRRNSGAWDGDGDDGVDITALLLARADGGGGGQALEAQLARMLEEKYRQAGHDASGISLDGDDL